MEGLALMALIRQERIPNLGFTIQPEENTLWGRVETFQAEVATPMHSRVQGKNERAT